MENIVSLKHCIVKKNEHRPPLCYIRLRRVIYTWVAPRPPDSYKMVDIFRMYDVDDSGCINLQEMTNIISTMDELEGEEKAGFHIQGYEWQIIWADDVNGDSNILVLLIHWWLADLLSVG